MAEAREEYGGYSGFAFVDKPSDALNCPICLCPMRDTVQTACGHRFCRSCLWQTFRQNNTRLCPQCRTSIRGNNQLFFDSAWQRDIDSLRVKCKSRKRGCAWIGAVGHYKEHKNVCNYRVVTCNDCGSKMLERHFNTHQTTECPFRTVLCEHCEEDFIAHFLEEHTATCPFRIVHCEHCGEDFIAHFIEMHQCEQRRNFREDECVEGEKKRFIRYQIDFLRKINTMNTKTAMAVASLHTAANYLDETWKEYNQMRSVLLLGKCVTLTGGFAAIAAGRLAIGYLWLIALGWPLG
ncbi:uncharacterized protein LOC144662619 isoform X1 [Oculina patagonica]